MVIAEGDNFIIKGAVIVENDNASFTIQHNASLLQMDEVDNIGEKRYKKQCTNIPP